MEIKYKLYPYPVLYRIQMTIKPVVLMRLLMLYAMAIIIVWTSLQR